MLEPIKIIDLPLCIQRFGRVYDREMVITCGRQEVSPYYCMGCGGHKTLMVKRSKQCTNDQTRE